MNDTEFKLLKDIQAQLVALNKKMEKQDAAKQPNYVPPEELVVCRWVNCHAEPVKNPDDYEIVRREAKKEMKYEATVYVGFPGWYDIKRDMRSNLWLCQHKGTK